MGELSGSKWWYRVAAWSPGVRRGTVLIFSGPAIMGCECVFVSVSVCLCEHVHCGPCSTWHSGFGAINLS